MHPDGTLEWTPPEGRWTIIRFGYSLTGHQNAPASPEATGLEVDKLNAGYVNLISTITLINIKMQQEVLWEKRPAVHYYRQLGGRRSKLDRQYEDRVLQTSCYDILPWMPVLTGQIVESAEAATVSVGFQKNHCGSDCKKPL